MDYLLMQKHLFNLIEKNSQRYIDELRDFVRLYPAGEKTLQETIKKKFETLGCDTRIFQLSPSTTQLDREFANQEIIDVEQRIHVVGRKSGNGSGKSLILAAHPDGDSVNIDGWKKPPHDGQIINGKMYGWAVADDLAGICIMLAALDTINEAGLRLLGDLFLFSATAKRNALGLAVLLNEGYSADGALYIHPAESELGLKEIKTLTSGLLKFRIKVKGKKPDKTEFVQVTFHHLGINPIDKALYLIEALKKIDQNRRSKVKFEPLEESIGRSTNLLITYIEAGKSDNLTDIPSECVLGIGLTYPPTEDIENVVEQIETSLKEAIDADVWLSKNPPELQWIQGTQGVETPMDHPLVETVVNSIEDITGVTPFSNPLYSKSDIRTPIIIRGIPVVGFGPLAGNLATTGGVNEWIDLDDYIKSVKICVKVILDWCGLERNFG
jgi:acetylornithine deacetylase